MLHQTQRRATNRVIPGAVILITGAAQGMGELYVRRAVHEGAAAVAIWDLDRDRAEALAAELDCPRTRVRAYVVDISHSEAVRATLQSTRDELGDPDVLINNAGIVRGALFWEQDAERDIELTMQINAIAPMKLTRAVLPLMLADASRPKRVLNIASAAGTLANPRMSVYAASKWAMIGWSESLRLELARTGHDHITVTTFCPSFISTGMFAGARGPLMTPVMTPVRAARAAWEGMIAGTPMVLRPWTVKLAMVFRGVLPTRVWDVVADRLFHVYSSMDAFTGRTR